MAHIKATVMLFQLKKIGVIIAIGSNVMAGLNQLVEIFEISKNWLQGKNIYYFSDLTIQKL